MEVDVPGVGRLRAAASSFSQEALAFRGIRYGRAERWRPPREVEAAPDGAVVDAREFGPRCVQRGSSDAGGGALSLLLGNMEMSEDCLFLNVYTRRDAVGPGRGADAGLPVMVFIHGGTYSSGESNEYDGSFLAAGSEGRRPVVLVDFNYRLNVFGFAAVDGADGELLANCGIMDQQLALRWVKRHIRHFGGDPENVTVFGQSAGANSILSHLVIESSFALYERAIIQSGAFSPGALAPGAARDRMGRVLAASPECASLTCLEGLDAAALSSAAESALDSSEDIFLMWSPVVDGALLTGAPADLIREGQYNKDAQIIIGSNRDDFAYFFFSVVPAVLAREGLATNASDFGEPEFEALASLDAFSDGGSIAARALSARRMAELKALYDPAGSAYGYPADRGGFTDWWWMAMRSTTDRIWGLGHCSVRHLARLLAAHGSRVFTYMLMYPVQSPLFSFIAGSGPGSVLVPHGAEVPYELAAGILLVDAGAKRLAEDVPALWTQFAATGDPNGGIDGAAWPPFTADGDETLLLDAPADLGGAGGLRAERGTRAAACDFWEEEFAEAARSAPAPAPAPASSDSRAGGSAPVVLIAVAVVLVLVAVAAGLLVWRRRGRLARLRRLALVEGDSGAGAFELPPRQADPPAP